MNTRFTRIELKYTVTGNVPEVTECAQAFRASLRLEYWGHGEVEVEWFLDDQPFDTSLAVLPRVSTADGEAGAAPAFIDMTSVLPTILRSQPYRVKARVRVRPTAPPAGERRRMTPQLPKGGQFEAEISPSAQAGSESPYGNLLLTAPIDPEVMQWAEERRYRVKFTCMASLAATAACPKLKTASPTCACWFGRKFSKVRRMAPKQTSKDSLTGCAFRIVICKNG